jgi:hypothetical protein
LLARGPPADKLCEVSMRLHSVRNLLLSLALAALPMSGFAFVSVGISVNIAPPALPVYEQPPCPAVGYIWTPGYWAWADDDYYWVPGTWVMAPEPGLLWTPGYWGWSEGVYLWHAGYWGPHVGFYGGVNYGFGYTGVGFEGGYWRGREFYYNRSVSNLGSMHVTNVYNRTVINNVTVNRVSYNGGTGGISARPTHQQLVAERERHIAVTNVQREHEHMASTNRDLRATANGGHPRIAATARPAVFTGRGVVPARALPTSARANAAQAASSNGAPGRTANPQARAQLHGRPAAASPAAARTDRPADRPGSSAMHPDRPAALARTDRPPTAGMRNERAAETSAHPSRPAADRFDRPSGMSRPVGPSMHTERMPEAAGAGRGAVMPPAERATARPGPMSTPRSAESASRPMSMPGAAESASRPMPMPRSAEPAPRPMPRESAREARPPQQQQPQRGRENRGDPRR